MVRLTLDEAMLTVAHVLSRRSTCAKKSVGCVLTDVQGRIIASGYNGAPASMQHCIDQPCPAFTDDTISCDAIHAEMNALMFCPDITKIHTVYITEEPCKKCLLMIQNTHATRIVIPDRVISL